MSEVEEKFKLNINPEVAKKYTCLAKWNAPVILSNGQKKNLNDLSVRQVENELKAGKLIGIFEEIQTPKAVEKPAGK